MAVPLYQRIAAERMTRAAHVIRDPTASPLERSQAAKALRSQTVRSAAAQVRPPARQKTKTGKKSKKRTQEKAKTPSEAARKGWETRRAKAEKARKRSEASKKGWETRRAKAERYRNLSPEAQRMEASLKGMANKLKREKSITQKEYNEIMEMDPQIVHDMLKDDKVTADYYYEYDPNPAAHEGRGPGQELIARYREYTGRAAA